MEIYFHRLTPSQTLIGASSRRIIKMEPSSPGQSFPLRCLLSLLGWLFQTPPLRLPTLTDTKILVYSHTLRQSSPPIFAPFFFSLLTTFFFLKSSVDGLMRYPENQLSMLLFSFFFLFIFKANEDILAIVFLSEKSCYFFLGEYPSHFVHIERRRRI